MKPTCIVDLAEGLENETDRRIHELRTIVLKIDRLATAETGEDTTADYATIRRLCEMYGIPVDSETTLSEVRGELYVRILYLKEIYEQASGAAWRAKMATKKARLSIDLAEDPDKVAAEHKKGKKLRELM